MTSAEQLPLEPTDHEGQPDKQHLSLVPAMELDSQKTELINANIAAVNTGLENYVPKSVEEANSLIEDFRRSATYIKQKATGYEVDGHPVEDGLAEEMLAYAELGTSRWLLSDEDKKTAHSILATPSYKKLAPEVRYQVRSLKHDANETNQTAFERYKAQTNDRLSLDEALRAQEGVVRDKELEEDNLNSTTEESDASEQVVIDNVGSDSTLAAGNELTGNKKRNHALADLVKVDTKGLGHREDGKFLSNQELDLIDEHAELIREGIVSREDNLKRLEQKKALMINFFGAEKYAERFGDNPKVDPDAWRRLEYGASKPDNSGRNLSEESEALPIGITEAQWNSLSDEEKQNLRSFQAAEAATQSTPFEQGDTGSLELRGSSERYSKTELTPTESPLVMTANGSVELRGSDERYDNTPEPIIDPSPKGLRARWNLLKAKAANRLLDAKDYFTDSEKGKRRKLIAGVAASLAVLGTVYLESRGNGVSHNAAGQTPGTRGNPMSAGKHAAKIARAAHAKYQEVTLKPGSGDSLWREETLHHPHATQSQIAERAHRDMLLNGIKNEQEAEHMSGTVKITR